MLEYQFPITASPTALIVVFAIALSLAHAVLLPALGLDEVKWQYIDYVWLPLALMGLVAAVHHTKQDVASTYASLARERSEYSWAQVRSWAETYSRDGSYLCRKAVRSSYSPPPEVFDAIELDYSSTCKWFSAIKSQLPKQAQEVEPTFSADSLPQLPVLSAHSGSGPSEALENFRRAVDQFSHQRAAAVKLQREASPPAFLRILQFIGPFVVAVALAIRITKVTGEVRIKRRKNRSAA